MIFDIIIVGGGPSGLTAALYALRAGKSVLIIEEGAFGGQITLSPKIENYPGHKSMSGNELAEMMTEQVMDHGAEIEIDKVNGIIGGDVKTVITENGRFRCLAVIIAVGVKHRMPGIDGEENYIGKGISFCAVCDGAFFKDKDVVVIGGGNSALQEATLLAQTCSHVTIIQDMPFLTGEKTVADALLKRDNVSVIYNSKLEAIHGNNELESITVLTDGKSTDIPCDGMFVAIGFIPMNTAFDNVAVLTEDGYFDSDESCTTLTKGVFVAGDCRRKSVRQVTTATSDGAVAAVTACKYIDTIK